MRVVDAPRAPAPLQAASAGFVASDVVAVVDLRRRRALRSALPHSRPLVPTPQAAETERRLHAAATPFMGERVRVALRAVRSLLSDSARVTLVRVGRDGELHLRLTQRSQLPPPWSGSGSAWCLPADIATHEIANWTRAAAPWRGALTTVGLDADGREVLVDLEAAALTVVAAQPDQAGDVIRALGVGLAMSARDESIHVVTAAMNLDIVPAHPHVHRRLDTPSAFDAIDALARPPLGPAEASDGGSVPAPVIGLFAHSDIAEAAPESARRSTLGEGAALVVASSSPDTARSAGVRIVARAHGWALETFDETIDLTPIGMSEAEMAAVVDLLQDTERCVQQPTMFAEQEIGEALPIEPTPHDIVVRVMGDIDVVDRTGRPARFDRPAAVELVAWLATHRSHPTRSAANTAIWQHPIRDAQFSNILADARRGLDDLSAPHDGTEWIARTLDESLPLHPRIVTDADLIAERVDHARRSPTAHAIDLLVPAVQMIRGFPFANARYAWPGADGTTVALTVLAITATCELAASALADDRIDLALWATLQGLSAVPGHEELTALRMRAHARRGDIESIRASFATYERTISEHPLSSQPPATRLLELRRLLLLDSV